jgi:sulfopyruvate decarboxylase subunit alpha
LASEAPRIILDGWKKAGIDLVGSLPDIHLAELLALIEEGEGITHVPVGREEEGIGIYKVLGRRPALM